MGAVPTLSSNRPACPKFVNLGIRMCRPFGCFVWQLHYGDGQIPFEFIHTHIRSVRMVFPCDDGGGSYREARVPAIADGWMPWGSVITHRMTYEGLPGFYSDIFHGKGASAIGAVVNWEGHSEGPLRC